MKKKILGILASLLIVTMFMVPVLAKPTKTPVTYFRVVDAMEPVVWRFAGESHVFIVVESVRSGSIYEGTDDEGAKLFTFTQEGKMKANMGQGKQVWHFDQVWTSTTVDGGFKGRLNGYAGGDGLYEVTGVLQGFGDLKGQKLVIEGNRNPFPDPEYPLGSADMTGFLIES
jgi:hypothetical protein